MKIKFIFYLALLTLKNQKNIYNIINHITTNMFTWTVLGDSYHYNKPRDIYNRSITEITT